MEPDTILCLKTATKKTAIAKVQITNAYTFWLLCSVMMNEMRIFYVTCVMNWTEYKTDQCQKKKITFEDVRPGNRS